MTAALGENAMADETIPRRNFLLGALARVVYETLKL